MRRRGLTEQDRQVWSQYVQQFAPSPTPPPEPAPAPPPPVAKPPLPRKLPTLEVGSTPAGVDRATWTRFRAGKLPVVRTLDLHGMTAHRAHEALHGFLARAMAERLRCVEIITGRGSGETGGVIRREFPHWLNGAALRPIILAAAHPHAANPGSVRLLLRRAR